MTTFGIAVWLYPEHEGYQAMLCDIIWSICNEYTWCLPAHLSGQSETETGSQIRPTIDLFAAETAFALAELAQLQKAWLPSIICKRIHDEVLQRVLNPFIEGSRYYGWEQAKHNWSAVCGGSVGAAALYILREQPEQLASVLGRVLPALECYLSGYDKDGVCTEGYGYWEYGFGYYVYFADLLKKGSSGKVNLFANEKVEQIARFQQKAFLDGRTVVNFSDALASSGVFMGLGHYLHLNISGVDAPPCSLMKSFSEDHCSRWAPAIRNLIWFNPEVTGETWSAGHYWLEDAQWLISRHVTAEGRYVLAAKGGHNAEPHNHNDLGHFILYGEGTTWLADLGSGLYTAQYFGEERYQIACNASFGHSVPIIDGAYQLAGSAHRANISHFELMEEKVELVMELTSAYEVPSLQCLERSLVWHKEESPYLELNDSYIFSAIPEQVIERFICAMKPSIEVGQVELAANDVTLQIAYPTDMLEPSVTEIEHINHFGHKQVFYALDFRILSLALLMDVKFVFSFQKIHKSIIEE
ncbi:Heparinase II/III-like protein [compost metagenome]